MSLITNSEFYYQNIRNKLTELCSLVAVDNSLNIQSLNIHAERFYAEFLNCLFGWNLVNANTAKQNAAGIDLIDAEKKIIVQVSSTNTRDKIKTSLSKSDKEEYSGYHFCFVAITEKETRYREFEVPVRLSFDKAQDVLSTPALLRHVLDAGIDKRKVLSDLVDKYFESNVAVQNIKWANDSQISKTSDEAQALSLELVAARTDFLKSMPQILQEYNVAEEHKENRESIIDIGEMPVLFSVGTKMAYDINVRFYNDIHYVWCAPSFNPEKQPPTSNPWELFIEYAKYAFMEDNHTNVIENNKTGIMKGARARKDQGKITLEMYNTISAMLRYYAKKEDFFPVIYIIPLSKVADYETRCKRVPKEDAASANSKEYIIEDLRRDEFYLIDLAELQKRIH